MRETRFSGTRFLPTNLNSHVNGTNPENLHVFNFKLSITPYKEKWWKVMEGGSSWHPKYKHQALSIMRHELKTLITLLSFEFIWSFLRVLKYKRSFVQYHTGVFWQYISFFQNHCLDNWLIDFSCIINNYFFYNEFPWGCIGFKGFLQRHQFLVCFWLP